MFTIFFLLLCVAAYTLSTEDPENLAPKCKTLFTFGYGYRQFFHMSPLNAPRSGENLLYMRFWVKARSDAHVLLSPSPSPEEIDPVYEIVLGAGKNSFSDIRRRRRANTKASAYTKDILSGTELKEFWVKMNSEGLIQVGSADNDLPFMQWQDPEPLHIGYFSFCTWSGVAGKWLYDCENNTDTGFTPSEEVEPILTDTERLRKALLTNYDVYSRPVINDSQITKINIQIQANHVQLDVKKSVMTVASEFTLVWYDQKMVWSPEHFNNLSKLHFIHHEIWQPELVHFNAVGKGVGVLDSAGMQVSSDGKVLWHPQSTIQSRCPLDLRQWPWDTQTCSVHLGFWSQADALQLLLLENGTKLELQHASSDWDVIGLGAETVITKSPGLLDPLAYSSDGSDDADIGSVPHTGVIFKFTLRRLNRGHYFTLIIPLLVLVVLSLTCFWMDPLGKEKLATHCLLLVLLCGFLLSLEGSLSAPADHTPYLMKVYSWVLAVVTCATIISVLISNLVQTSLYRPAPRLLSKTMSSGFVISLFCLPKYNSGADYYDHLRTSGMVDCLSLVTEQAECDSGANLTRVIEYNSATNLSWVQLAVFCDRVTFCVALISYTAIFLAYF